MRFNVVRGQWLLVCDERTDNPLSFLLMPDRNYNSRVIRTLNTKTFSDERIGLPFKPGFPNWVLAHGQRRPFPAFSSPSTAFQALN